MEDEKKYKKVWCKNCFGTGYIQNAYANPKCDVCMGRGFTWKEVRKYVKRIKPAKNEPVLLKQPTVICRASFYGEVTKEQLYLILNYIDDMKIRGFSFDVHERTEMTNGNVKINYVLVLYQEKG
jgi:hypothetical protein